MFRSTLLSLATVDHIKKFSKYFTTLVIVLAAVPATSQVPFACDNDVHIAQGEDAQLYRCDSSFSCTPFALQDDIEINNIGFRNMDGSGFLYAVELTSRQNDGRNGNNGIIRIDSAGNIFPLDPPLLVPLPDVRFDAGDISADGNTMYINRAGFSPLYTVDLASMWPTWTEVAIHGATGHVNDWAYNPADGNLYGGDSSGAGGVGQLAKLNLETIGTGAVHRSDVTVPGLPTGFGYGSAWFETDTGHLFLQENSGMIFEIDLAGPAIVETHGGPGSSHNDGAVCHQGCGPTVCAAGTVLVSGGSFTCTPPAPGEDSVRVEPARALLRTQGIEFLVVEESEVGSIRSRSSIFLDRDGAQVGSSFTTSDAAQGSIAMGCSKDGNEMLFNGQFANGSAFSDTTCSPSDDAGSLTVSQSVNQHAMTFSVAPDGTTTLLEDSWGSLTGQEDTFIEVCSAVHTISAKKFACGVGELVCATAARTWPAVLANPWLAGGAAAGCAVAISCLI